jgi:hypothetical protein
MADSDFDTIQPVESLHTVQGLTAAKDREERRRRQRTLAEPREPSKQKEQDKEKTPSDGESHTIDYCA